MCIQCSCGKLCVWGTCTVFFTLTETEAPCYQLAWSKWVLIFYFKVIFVISWGSSGYWLEGLWIDDWLLLFMYQLILGQAEAELQVAPDAHIHYVIALLCCIATVFYCFKIPPWSIKDHQVPWKMWQEHIKFSWQPESTHITLYNVCNL